MISSKIEFEEIKKEISGTVIKINPINNSRRINVLPYFIDYIAHEQNLQIPQGYLEEIMQNQNY